MVDTRNLWWLESGGWHSFSGWPKIPTLPNYLTEMELIEYTLTRARDPVTVRVRGVGGPPRLPTVAEPDIYKRFFQAHQRTPGKKQFLGTWRQNSKGANFNWGDPAGDSTDPKHYNHIHLGYI